MLIVAPDDPCAPGPRALLQDSRAMMLDLFPAEDCYGLTPEALTAPHIAFFTAREGGAVLGTGALAVMEGYGEVKAMFTAPNARGRGVGAALLRQIEDEARARALPCLRLETGKGLDDAIRLYERDGFERRGIFGDYQPNETSVFMEKPLDDSGAAGAI
ncbi:putative acetyltransferase [Roseovarius halotolerans]|uniref:Putative N-acetyltransferase YsnE n=1 Tax=Roseovarius halotolerans TaxID=505353 RepID=A0A1X6ZPG0_9RHOB|nr:GNAT family N-acetyltransferase [Roseovarius halotolerans]RKT28062.1 putative acetyltransferase [Roseovarius halotolerans]SLN57763.1 putative N-acetyltransferase YsnE [Roseovarius halotolerans]